MTQTRIDRADLKLRARESMRLARPRAALVTLVFLLLTTGLTAAVDLVGGISSLGTYSQAMNALEYADTPEEILQAMSMSGGQSATVWLLGVAVSLFCAVVSFGYQSWSLKVSRGKETGVREVIAGFGCMGRVLGVNVMFYLYSIAAAMVAMLAALGCAFLMLMVVMACNLPGDMGGIIVAIATVVMAIAAVIAAEVFLLRYSMAIPALANDPELRTWGALAYSQKLMRGHKWEYIKLNLSFLGWYLLQGLIVIVVVFAVMWGMLLTVASGLLTNFPINGEMEMMEVWMAEYMRSIPMMTVVLTVASTVAAIPFALWLTPYRSVTEANYFYALVEQDEEAGRGKEGFWDSTASAGTSEPAEPAEQTQPPAGPEKAKEIPPAPTPAQPETSDAQEPAGEKEDAVPTSPQPEAPAEEEKPEEEPSSPAEPERPWGDDRSEPF